MSVKHAESHGIQRTEESKTGEVADVLGAAEEEDVHVVYVV